MLSVCESTPAWNVQTPKSGEICTCLGLIACDDENVDRVTHKLNDQRQEAKVHCKSSSPECVSKMNYEKQPPTSTAIPQSHSDNSEHDNVQ